MADLDLREDVLRHDPKGMYGFTEAFPQQIEEASRIASEAALPDWSAKPDVVVLTGMGGSAAGGDFVKALFDHFGNVPFQVLRDYDLPNWVGSGALVFAVSYSGNTEETLASYESAKRRGANIICVTSGGQLAERAVKDGFPLITIPGGQPPRTALGYLLIPVIVAAVKLGLLPNQDIASAAAVLRGSQTFWGVGRLEQDNEAKKLARICYGKPIVVYGLGGWQGAAAYRWKGQLCENAKAMAFSHTYPELCHNEVLGWHNSRIQSPNGWALLTLTDGRESAKMEARGRVTAELISGYAVNHNVKARGETLLERMLSTVFLGDYVSLYLAALYSVDPESIDLINKLKAELANVPG
jgi:glucose/mannose-6-phosphate isomerase